MMEMTGHRGDTLSSIVNSGREDGLGNSEANDPEL